MRHFQTYLAFIICFIFAYSQTLWSIKNTPFFIYKVHNLNHLLDHTFSLFFFRCLKNVEFSNVKGLRCMLSDLQTQ